MTPVRSLFFSDLHLGFRFSRSTEFLSMLRDYEMQYLYLAGDFLDGWRLAQNWYWPPLYNEIVDHILELARSGVQIFYTPGNHDEFLRQPHPAIDGIRVADEFFHTTADGRRLLVTHGDLFDSVEKRFHRTSRLGSRIYDSLMWTNYGTNQLLGRLGMGELNYCFAVKRWSKRMVGAIGSIQHVLIAHARELDCAGVVCGHIHLPEILITDGIAWCNTGDWVEHQSMIVEQTDGTLQLLDQGRVINQWLPQSPSQQPARPGQRLHKATRP